MVALLVALVLAQDEGLRPVPLQSKVTHVQPMTGIVLWSDSEHAKTDAIQLEFSYLRYGDVVAKAGEYEWASVERVLNAIAGRGHQAVLRFYDTYVGRKTTLPDYIKKLPDYKETTAPSEKKPTDFPDWSHPEVKRFILEFYSKFAEKYDRDPRLAFLETGFGLWSEYHIYDGPMKLGKTFPDHDFQEKFLRSLAAAFKQTPWMISVDAASEESAPFASRRTLLDLSFGTFDDSFLCRQHAKENEPNWNFFGRERPLRAPAGGEFSYYTVHDQKQALAAEGPYGVSFEKAARAFHITFMIGNDQPDHQKLERIREAGLACGYRFRVTDFRTGAGRSKVTVFNAGIAPLYHDAYVAVGGVKSKASLKGLAPGASRTLDVESGGEKVGIESDRLVPGQRIEFDADLKR
ncbi:MAG: DUF4832 domain-containing protein [Planctomycetes bacterium]|nr:DUF4832 domain-containing protein [Planctomycetota bacterium]